MNDQGPTYQDTGSAGKLPTDPCVSRVRRYCRLFQRNWSEVERRRRLRGKQGLLTTDADDQPLIIQVVHDPHDD